MKQNTKDWIQYINATALIISAIVIAFVAFFIINDVPGGVNTYIGIAVSGGLAIFGVAAYMVNQVTQFKTEVRRELEEIKRKEATVPGASAQGQATTPTASAQEETGKEAGDGD